MNNFNYLFNNFDIKKKITDHNYHWDLIVLILKCYICIVFFLGQNC